MEMILKSADCTEKTAKVQAPKKAFMDDVTLLKREHDEMQKVLNKLDKLITRSRMKFKAKKSRSLTFSNRRQMQSKFQISGEKMPTIKEQPVKSLGRCYEGNFNDKSRGVQIERQLEDGLKAIDETKLPGKYKIWCLQFGLYLRIAWSLMMYETTASRVDIMEQKCNVKIKRWLGLTRMTNTAALYRKKGSLQLALTTITEIYKAGKVRTVMMLRESADIEIRSNPPDVETAQKWNAENETNHLTSSLQHRDIIGSK